MLPGKSRPRRGLQKPKARTRSNVRAIELFGGWEVSFAVGPPVVTLTASAEDLTTS